MCPEPGMVSLYLISLRAVHLSWAHLKQELFKIKCVMAGFSVFGLRANVNCYFPLKQRGLGLERAYLDDAHQSEGQEKKSIPVLLCGVL